MRQAKKIFTRMCINNWGGIGHKIIEINEYVNLFSGKSGSGKSTVMDAIQVILYGSFSSAFLNRAADDAKNRRSVLSYLRGAQKDGTANRDSVDFYSQIVLELEDTGTHIVTCVGVAFEVGKQDTDVKKYFYFSHSGKIPEDGYLREDGIPYSNQEINNLIMERTKSADNRGKGDVNRTYPSREAYLNTVYEVIFGYIDVKRFITMEKSAIALKMTSGTGQFIRDYMFPKSTENTIEKISDQLGAYRDIKERIDDLEKRIGYLMDIQIENKNLLNTKADIIKVEAILKCIEIEQLKSKIQAGEDDFERILKQIAQIQESGKEWKAQLSEKNHALIDVESSLKASDYGEKKQQLKQMETVIELRTSNSVEWRRLVNNLRQWESDEIVTDYVSNTALQLIGNFQKGNVTSETCDELRRCLVEAKDAIEEERQDINQEKKELSKELEEKKNLIDDIKNNRKPYKSTLKQARSLLERKLSDRYGRTIKVQIFADLFDIKDEEWKNAIEGRLGRIKFSLITEPQYAHDAAALFRQMKQWEDVELINSAAIEKDHPNANNGSLYEAVKTESTYVDACLKRYLGRIMKCHSVEDLEQVRDGVTPDCYSYSNYIFRHLRERDYTVNASIGSKVSKARLPELEADVEKMEHQLGELITTFQSLKASQNFEALNGDTNHIIKLSGASKELEKALKEKEKLQKVIQELEKGKVTELKEQRDRLIADMEKIDLEIETVSKEEIRLTGRRGSTEKDIAVKKEILAQRLEGYVPNEQIEEEVKDSLTKQSEASYKNFKSQEIGELLNQEQAEKEQLAKTRQKFNMEYPACGFSGLEKSNDVYDNLLTHYQRDYVPEYQSEFQKQCDQVYKSLRDNVIATIHGDIKAAFRHANEINRMLKEVSFSDSIYQIEVKLTENENSQFCEMLMAEELDSKVIYNDGFSGQISLGEDAFLQKYEEKIQLLTEKFMPVKDGDDKQITQKKKEMERYADYRNYLSFSMFERVVDKKGNERRNYVDEMAGRDSGGEGQNPKYVALLAGFAMLYKQQSNRDSRIKLVLLDEAFSKMDQERSEVCLRYARKLELQLIVCVPDERLSSLIQNVDCVYGFRRHHNQITMMHIDKGQYLQMLEGSDADEESDGKTAKEPMWKTQGNNWNMQKKRF